MKNIINNIKEILKLKKVRFLLVILLVGMVSVIVYYEITTSVLVVSVEPKEAEIVIDEKIKGVGYLQTRLPKGTHTISSSLEGYVPTEELIDLQSSMSVQIALNLAAKNVDANVETYSNISPFLTANPSVVAENTLLFLDVKTAHLKKLTDGKVSEIFSKPVRFYSFEFPWVALVEKSDGSKITIVDVRNNSIKTFQTQNLDSIISVSVSEDLTSLYVLGNYDTVSRKSKLYVSPLASFSPNPILETLSNQVVGLSSDKTFLYQSVEAQGLSNISIVDVNSKAVIYKKLADKYLFSKAKEYLALQSTDSLSIVKMEGLSSIDIPLSSLNKLAWKEDSTLLILKNTNPGVQLQYLNVVDLTAPTFLRITSLDNTTVLSAIGVNANQLFVLDIEGKVLKIDLPLP